MENNEIKAKKPFGFMDKLAYAAGDFGCNMSFALKGTVQTFWLVFMMMETGLLSALLLVVQIWDAVNDPLIGSLIDADKRKYKMGKFKTYILIGAIGLTVAGSLMFIPAAGAAPWIKAILFVVGYVIWDACYTVANVPYGSMLSLVTEDAGERADLSTWRSIGSMIGNILTMVLLPMLIWKKVTWTGNVDDVLKQITLPTFKNDPDGSKMQQFLDGIGKDPKTGEALKIGDTVLNPFTGSNMEILLGNRVFWIALVMGVLGLIAFLFMIKKITIRVDENTVKTNEQTEKINIFKAFGKFFKNRPAVGATIAAMGMFLGMNSASTATTIMFATHFGKASLSGVVTMIGFLPMMFFIPFIKKMVTKYGKKECSVVGTLISCAGVLLMLVFPMIENKTVSMLIFVVALCIFGIGMGVYTCVSWALMSDAIDYNEWKFGTREEGTVYSLHSFFRKLAQGVGPAAVLFIMGLAFIGYDADLGTYGQSAETAQNMCWLVAILYAISGILQFVGLALVYNLDKKTLETMTSELEARRAAQATEVVAEPVTAAE